MLLQSGVSKAMRGELAVFQERGNRGGLEIQHFSQHHIYMLFLEKTVKKDTFMTHIHCAVAVKVV
jgi:hypothetical protein